MHFSRKLNKSPRKSPGFHRKHLIYKCVQYTSCPIPFLAIHPQRYKFLSQPASPSRVSIYQQFKVFKGYGSIIQIHRRDEAKCDVHYRSLNKQPLIKDMECASECFEYRPMPYEHGPNAVPKSSSPVVRFKGLQTAPAQNAPSHILRMLNDDCLFHAFRRMHLLDLVQVANVCRRFQQIAANVFLTRYPRGKFDLRDLRHSGDVTLSQMDDCLQAFGACIKSIDVTFELHEEILLGMVAEHCTHLEELEFNGASVTMETILALRPFVEQLTAVTLRTMTDDIALMFSARSRLQTLYIHSRVGSSTLPATLRLPQLRDVQLIGVLAAPAVFEAFIQRHGTIERLLITDRQLDRGLMHSIPRHLARLERLVLVGNCPEHTFFSNWERLKCLRQLVFDGRNYPVAGILQSLVDGDVPLEGFRLSSSRIDHPSIMAALCRLTTVSDVELTQNGGAANVTDGDLARLARSLAGLRSIRVTSPTLTLNGIRLLLKHADELRHAHFRIDFRHCVNYHTDARHCDFIGKSMCARGGKMSVTISGLSGDRAHVSGVSFVPFAEHQMCGVVANIRRFRLYFFATGQKV